MLRTILLAATLALPVATLSTPAAAATVPEALAMASAARQQAGLPPLRSNARLARAAEAQARHMRSQQKMGHVGPGGNSLSDRARAAGYRMCYGAENVADGWPSVNAVHRAWMNSPSHQKNIMNPNVTEGAVAAVQDGNGRLWWVMVLGSRC
ncbi:CAP domain-containing protein [Jannaschia donghaensis]|uniref:Cysteine-rich secretory protein family protein n=1 Tax=Jannaschia donghaensis TaxID=420998 RepID=A0A0M6YFH9_9RHOB|nr:CAP domain-containing protein [Jannaschia donghaensis]CTQ48425.1 Cysteine-rich secretory protein family protein [Jannaschia donghaensis]